MEKKRIQIVASEETYKKLQTFNDIRQLNEAVRAYKKRFKDVLTKSAIKILEFIHGYSAKYTGVSFLYKNTIANELGISRRTVIRACQLLESLGIIRQYEMKRKSDMKQTGNAIVIQPIEEEKTEVVTQEQMKMSHQENNIFLKQIYNINHLNNRRSPYIKFVPKSLQHFQAYFGSHIKTLYGRMWLAAKNMGITVDQETMQTIGFKAMEQLKQYVKDGKELTSEQQCKLVYKISYNQLKQRLDSGEIYDWNYEADQIFALVRKSRDLAI